MNTAKIMKRSLLLDEIEQVQILIDNYALVDYDKADLEELDAELESLEAELTETYK